MCRRQTHRLGALWHGRWCLVSVLDALLDQWRGYTERETYICAARDIINKLALPGQRIPLL